MKWMCLSLAQEMTLDTATESRTSMALCAKLAAGVAEKYASVKKSLVDAMGSAYQVWSIMSCHVMSCHIM